MKTIGGLLALSVLLGACTAGAASSPAPTGSPPTAPPSGSPSPDASGSPDALDATLVLRIESVGGLMGPDFAARAMPTVSVYSDGRVISQGAQIAIFPGPALPSLQVSRLSPAGLQRLVDAAVAAGLGGRNRHLDLEGIMDATTTVFTLIAGGTTHTVSAYALGEGVGMDDRMSPEERDARAALLELSAAATDLTWLGTDVVANGLPYEMTALRVFATPSDGRSTEPGAEILEWPLDTPLGEIGAPFPLGPGVRCAVIDGDDLEALLPLLQAANQLTQWESEEGLYGLTFRPLLPDESGCPVERP
jgi:hypothetical protein